MEVLLETRDIKKHFPVKKKLFDKGPQKVVKAVDGVSLKNYKGEALGLIGESGCGKSTFSRVVMQLIDATEDEIYFEGEPVTPKNIMHFRQKVQLVKGHFNQEMIHEAHENGIRCNVFWSDDPDETRRFLEMGIDTILTNEYLKIAPVVNSFR